MSLLVSLLGLMGWAIWGYTVVYVDPQDQFARVAFYSGLFVALTCTLARLREAPGYLDASGLQIPPKPTLGHAAAVATLVTFALWLQSLRMLTALNGILLVLTLCLIEIGFRLSRGRRPSKPRRRTLRPVVSDSRSSGELAP